MKSSNSNFIDYVKIFCVSGNGGGGSSHFSKSKIKLNGKPDGGDGGSGGSIIVEGDRNKWTLLHLKYTKHISANNGGNGSRNLKYGVLTKSREVVWRCARIGRQILRLSTTAVSCRESS